jgi:hypothetical protein
MLEIRHTSHSSHMPCLFLSLLEFLKKLVDNQLNSCCLIFGVDFHNIYLAFLHTKNLKSSII